MTYDLPTSPLHTHTPLFAMHCHPRPCPISPSPQVLKVGFGLSGDLSKLAGSWPGSRCWQEVGPTLDLLPLWVAAGLRAKVGAG